mmetsp:Transcript_44216/g.99455  ORF Transcript_44216/g.99455 Transcript_44216/m.99455 type:complete len:287 (-) Transcript_44216:558-1418(-)
MRWQLPTAHTITVFRIVASRTHHLMPEPAPHWLEQVARLHQAAPLREQPLPPIRQLHPLSAQPQSDSQTKLRLQALGLHQQKLHKGRWLSPLLQQQANEVEALEIPRVVLSVRSSLAAVYPWNVAFLVLHTIEHAPVVRHCAPPARERLTWSLPAPCAGVPQHDVPSHAGRPRLSAYGSPLSPAGSAPPAPTQQALSPPSLLRLSAVSRQLSSQSPAGKPPLEARIALVCPPFGAPPISLTTPLLAPPRTSFCGIAVPSPAPALLSHLVQQESQCPRCPCARLVTR